MARSSPLLLALSLVAPACASVGTPRDAVLVSRRTTVANTTEVAMTTAAGEWFQAAPVRSRVVVGADGETYVGLWIDAPRSSPTATGCPSTSRSWSTPPGP